MRQRAMSAELVPDASLSRHDVRSVVERVIVFKDRVEVALAQHLDCAEPIIVPATLISRSREKRLSAPNGAQFHTLADPTLVKLIVRAFQVRQLIESADTNALAAAADQLDMSIAYFAALLRLSYLAPDIVAAILDGRKPAALNRQRLARATLPIDWQEQRALLGFA